MRDSSNVQFLIADLNLDELAPAHEPSYLFRQAGIICGATVAVLLPVLIWVAFFRKRRKRRRRHEHRPLNPTLAQTGGLPQARPDPPSEPSS